MNVTILIVDDNPLNVELLEHVVQACGYDVVSAMDGLRAQQIAKARRPALILMDLQMPGLDGLTVARALKSEPTTRGIPIIAVTSYASGTDREHAMQAGMDDYITKPVDLDDLPRRIRRWVEAA